MKPAPTRDSQITAISTRRISRQGDLRGALRGLEFPAKAEGFPFPALADFVSVLFALPIRGAPLDLAVLDLAMPALGVLDVEIDDLERVILNEIAPRLHNLAHQSIKEVSSFRCILDLHLTQDPCIRIKCGFP